MRLDDLDWAAWHDASDAERKALVTEAAARVGGAVGRGPQGPVVEVRGATFVLVPGGKVTLGWDGKKIALDAGRRERWADEDDVGYASFEAFLRGYLGRPRTVKLAPFLAETTAGRAKAYAPRGNVDACDDVAAEVRAAIAQQGFRLLTNDEWEAAARAGATTLFAWGDAWPDGEPGARSTKFRRHREPNALGLAFGDNPYQPEFVAEPNVVRHGDGGSALCGGQPNPEAWYSFALAFQYPRKLWEDAVTEMYAEGRVRRALSLSAAVAQSAKATKAVKAKPGKMANAAKAAKPAKPVKSAKPAATAKATKPARAVKLAKPAKAIKAAKPARVAKAAKPARAAKAAKPAKGRALTKRSHA